MCGFSSNIFNKHPKKQISMLYILICLFLIITYGILTQGVCAAVAETTTGNITSEKASANPQITENAADEDTIEIDDSEDDSEGFEEEDDWAEEDPFSYYGFIELENYYNTATVPDTGDRHIKSEIRTQAHLKYGNEKKYGFTRINLYALPTFVKDTIGEKNHYINDSQSFRNLRLSNSESEVNFSELYFNWQIKNSRFRIGNQIFEWGTADLRNPTAYVNPYDYREFIFKDSDERKIPVPAISWMQFNDGYTIEGVFTPVHIPGILPVTNNYWAPKTIEERYPLTIGDSEPLPIEAENFGYGLRVLTSWKNCDFSISGYHGPDRDPVLLPFQTVLEPNTPVGVMAKPTYYISDSIGFDISAPFSNFVFQFECAYTPNKKGFINQKFDKITDVKFPYETKNSEFYACGLGFNYFVPVSTVFESHEGDAVLTIEFSKCTYLDDEIHPQFLSDIIAGRFQDTFLENELKIYFTGIYDLNYKGTIFWPEIEYAINSNLKARLAYTNVEGKFSASWDQTSLLYYFTNNDFITLRLRYVF